jgi:hypothetical protein
MFPKPQIFNAKATTCRSVNPCAATPLSQSSAGGQLLHPSEVYKRIAMEIQQALRQVCCNKQYCLKSM